MPKNQEMPDIDIVKKWVRKDMESAQYLLAFILQRHPEIIDAVAEEIYNKSILQEQGPAVSHLNKND